jgi:hypothetical protein
MLELDEQALCHGDDAVVIEREPPQVAQLRTRAPRDPLMCMDRITAT